MSKVGKSCICLSYSKNLLSNLEMCYLSISLYECLCTRVCAWHV